MDELDYLNKLKNFDCFEIFSFESKSFSIKISSNKIIDCFFEETNGNAIRINENNKLLFIPLNPNDDFLFKLNFARKNAKYKNKVYDFNFTSKEKIDKSLSLDKNILKNFKNNDFIDIEKAIKQIIKSKKNIIEAELILSLKEIKIENSIGAKCRQKKTNVFFATENYYKKRATSRYFNDYFLDLKKIKKCVDDSYLASKNLNFSKKPDKNIRFFCFTNSLLSNLLSIFLYGLSFDAITSINKFKEGEKITSKKINIISDPLINAVNRTAFDGQANKTRKKYIVKKGILNYFLLDNYSFLLLKQKGKIIKNNFNTTNRNSFFSPPSVSLINSVITSNETDNCFDKEYILIENAHGFHTADPITGDISIQVEEAYLIKKDKKYPLSGFSLSFNVYKMFLEIKTVLKENEIFSNTCFCKIIFKDLKIIG